MKTCVDPWARDLNLNLSMGFPARCRYSKCTLTHKRYCNIALSITFVIWRGQAPLSIWKCSSSEKICVWRYVSLYYLLEFTTFAVDHDPNASLSCAFTWKPLNYRLNCNKCYCGTNKTAVCNFCLLRGDYLRRGALLFSQCPSNLSSPAKNINRCKKVRCWWTFYVSAALCLLLNHVQTSRLVCLVSRRSSMPRRTSAHPSFRPNSCRTPTRRWPVLSRGALKGLFSERCLSRWGVMGPEIA